MSYLDLFQRYGSPSREAEIRLHGYLIRPDTLTADRIQYSDETAARLIEDCRRLADQLTDYRQALAERYAALATAAYRDRLELTRDPGYRGKLDFCAKIENAPRVNALFVGILAEISTKGGNVLKIRFIRIFGKLYRLPNRAFSKLMK